MKKLEDYTPEEVAGMVSIIGILISRKFTIIERLIIASILSGISQALLITVAQANFIANIAGTSASTNSELQDQINELKKHIKKLEDDESM